MIASISKIYDKYILRLLSKKKIYIVENNNHLKQAK